MPALRDIRDFMPRTAQQDPNKFPAYEYRPYPRMMKDENNKPLKDKAGNIIYAHSEAEESRLMGKPLTQEEPAAGLHEVSTEANQPEETRRPDAPLRNKPGRPPTKLPKDLK